MKKLNDIAMKLLAKSKIYVAFAILQISKIYRLQIILQQRIL